MNDETPKTPEEKLSISLDHLSVVTLMHVASESPAEARKQVEDLSHGATKRMLSAAIAIGGLLLRYDAVALERGAAASATELFTAIANSVGEQFTPPGTVH